MIKVYTQFEVPEKKNTEAGRRYLNTYQEEIDKETGKKRLVKSGETNIYAMIQEDLEASKIENILQKAAMGDLDALNQRETLYIDSTNMPKTLMEAQNIVLKAKQEFEKLPLEVRKEFDMSAEKYISEMGTNEFNEKMAPYNKRIAEIEEAGNLKEYEKKVKAQAKFEKDVAAAKGVEA